jgi:hypothetical protein
MEELPEFRVSLERVPEGETAYPRGKDIPHYEYQGRRTKLGGKPDWMQAPEGTCPTCPKCGEDATFVAQIDSVEHKWRSNPHAMDYGEQKWMFGDVGMIYVFFCFDCLTPVAVFECG